MIEIEGDELVDELRYCLTNGFPAKVTAALLRLVSEPDTLDRAARAWQKAEWPSRWVPDNFLEAVEQVTNNTAILCYDCDSAIWADEAISVNRDDQVCESCMDNYSRCASCEELCSETTYVGSYDEDYCSSCLDAGFHWCDHCEQYIGDEDDEHGHDCDCEAPHPDFKFPNNGNGTVENDERLTVQLPRGHIDDEGLWLIQDAVTNAITTEVRWQIPQIMGELGPVWQTKRGNFTRRLSSALHKKGVRLPAEVISEVGNIAKAHSSDEAAWYIEFTRDLNQSAEYFYHEGSCWFSDGSYADSRCCLKNWGGLAIRSFSDEDSDPYDPNGRAWIQPLNADLQPTHDAENAHAYVIYNGYGDLDMYTPARIIAHLTGKTYKKISFEARNQYVNSGSGYLVSDEQTCADTTDISLYGNPHDGFDARTYKTLKGVA